MLGLFREPFLPSLVISESVPVGRAGVLENVLGDPVCFLVDEKFVGLAGDALLGGEDRLGGNVSVDDVVDALFFMLELNLSADAEGVVAVVEAGPLYAVVVVEPLFDVGEPAGLEAEGLLGFLDLRP